MRWLRARLIWLSLFLGGVTTDEHSQDFVLYDATGFHTVQE